MLGFHPAHGASQVWDGGSMADSLWSTAQNWLGDPTPPGGVGTTTNVDVATFSAAIANTWGDSALNAIGVDLDRNLGGISFTGNSGSYFIGATGGNALKLSNGGTIQILQALTAANAFATINAPLQIQGADGLYTLRNDSASGSGAGAGTLRIGGNITGTAGVTGLFLTGTNTNANTIDGIISNGGAAEVYLHKTGAGNWTLTAANTYAGTTNVEGGTLTLAFGNVAANILPAGNSLVLQGGTLRLTGTGSQTVTGLTTTANTASRIVLGADETLTLGSLLSAGSGSALSFNLAAGGANGASVGTGVVVLTGQTPGMPSSPATRSVMRAASASPRSMAPIRSSA